MGLELGIHLDMKEEKHCWALAARAEKRCFTDNVVAAQLRRTFSANLPRLSRRKKYNFFGQYLKLMQLALPKIQFLNYYPLPLKILQKCDSLYIHVYLCKFSKIFLLPVTFKILHPQLTAGYVQVLWTSEQVYLVLCPCS